MITFFYRQKFSTQNIFLFKIWIIRLSVLYFFFFDCVHITACKVLPFQMQQPMQQKSRKILRKVHLPSASALNNITCPHLTSVQDRWDMLCFGWPIHPADKLDPHWQAHEVQFFSPRIPWKCLQTCLWSSSKDKKQTSVWMKVWTCALNGEQIFLLCDPAPHQGIQLEVFRFSCKVWDSLVL